MSIQDFFDSMEDCCRPETQSSGFQWSATSKGFGSFYFFTREADDHKVLYCENECMGKEFIKEMLCKMVDECVLMDEKDEDGNWKPRP